MMTRTLWFFLSLLVASNVHGNPMQGAPDPADYPAATVFHGKPAAPILSSRLSKLFRTKIREGAKLGPNFAGHHTVVSWGCGLGSYTFVVVDAITGKVYEPPIGCITLAGAYDIPIPGFQEISNPGFKLNSKLILVVGIEDRDDAQPTDRAATVYLFDHGQFRKLFSTPAPLE
jgi:hypothetical protein